MRFNPFKLADDLIEKNYEIPIFDSHLKVASDDSFMTSDNFKTINLGEYLDFIRAWATSDRTKETNGIKHCPFCGSKAEVVSKDESASSDGYYSGSKGFVVKCGSCNAENGYTYAKFFSDFTKHTYQDFKENLILRVEENEKYEKYLEDCKKESIEKWNKRKVW